MNIHEYQAKQLFQAYGIPSPQSKQVTTADAAVLATREIAGKAWVVKAQVHAGDEAKSVGSKSLEIRMKCNSLLPGCWETVW